MREVFAKIDGLLTEIELLKVNVQKQLDAVNAEAKVQSNIKEKLDARDTMLSARERIVKKAEDEKEMKEDLNTLKLEVQLRNEDLNKKEKELNAKLEKFAKDKKAHDEMVEMYKIKSARVGKIEEDMIELKKNMRAVILKEIGDKLA